MMDGIALANNIAVGLYGMILSAAFCDMTWTARRRWVFTGCMAVILALQGVVTWRFAAETTRCLYPLITHLPLAVTLGVMNRRALWPTIAVLTAYLCCQLRRWIALLIVALLHSALFCGTLHNASCGTCVPHMICHGGCSASAVSLLQKGGLV